MPKCINCNRKYASTMGFSCKYCNSEFCVSCISAETHKCFNIATRDSVLRDQLSKKLIYGKTMISKVQKIG